MPADPSNPKRQPPAVLFALGNSSCPPELTIDLPAGPILYHFRDLFKHDFFALTALYAADDPALPLAVLKVQRTYPLYGLPMQWLGRIVANHEIKVYQRLQGIRGIPRFLGRVGPTGFLHEFIPGTDLHARLPLTPAFFEDLERLFRDVHDRHVAYVDANKRENILHGNDGRPWLIDFQISVHTRGDRSNFLIRWFFRRLVRADWYHFFKHKTRLLPAHCTPADFQKAHSRDSLHKLHRCIARPLIYLRRKWLSRYNLVKTR